MEGLEESKGQHRSLEEKDARRSPGEEQGKKST